MKNEIDDIMEDKNINDKWECYACCIEDDFSSLPSGYLGNYHPLCLRCANKIRYDKEHRDRFRLTYHIEHGDLLFVENIFFRVPYNSLLNLKIL